MNDEKNNDFTNKEFPQYHRNDKNSSVSGESVKKVSLEKKKKETVREIPDAAANKEHYSDKSYAENTMSIPVISDVSVPEKVRSENDFCSQNSADSRSFETGNNPVSDSGKNEKKDEVIIIRETSSGSKNGLISGIVSGTVVAAAIIAVFGIKSAGSGNNDKTIQDIPVVSVAEQLTEQTDSEDEIITDAGENAAADLPEVTLSEVNDDSSPDNETDGTEAGIQDLTLPVIDNNGNAASDAGSSKSTAEKIKETYYSILSSDPDFIVPVTCCLSDINNQGYEMLIVPDINTETYKIYRYQDDSVYSYNFGRWHSVSETELYQVRNDWDSGHNYIYYRCNYAYKSIQGYYDPLTNEEVKISLVFSESGSGAYDVSWVISFVRNGRENKAYSGSEMTDRVYGSTPACYDKILQSFKDMGFQISDDSSYNYIESLNPDEAFSKLGN